MGGREGSGEQKGGKGKRNGETIGKREEDKRGKKKGKIGRRE